MSFPGGTAWARAGVLRGPEAMRAYVLTARPRQWIKNLLVVAAAGAGGALGHDDVPARMTVTFAAFCLLASGIYAINDVRDAHEDRLHPRKRLRPVAAGQLDPRRAVVFGLALALAGLLACFAVRPLLAVVAAGYVALTLSYTMIWRQVLLFDVVAVAGGFVLRAVAGGVATPVTLSRWFVAVVTCSALFVAAGKRQAELRRAQASGEPVRRVLEYYGSGRLKLILVVTGAGALVAYAMWAAQLIGLGGIPWRSLTIIPFTICLVRYGARLRAGDGESPDELLLGDRWLLSSAVVWLVLFALAVHAS